MNDKKSQPRSISKKKLRRSLNLTSKERLPNLAIIADVFDNAAREAYYQVAFKTEYRRFSTIHIKQGQKYSPNDVRNTLKTAHAVLPSDAKKATEVVTSAFSRTPIRWHKMSAGLGWQGDNTSFVLPHRVIGSNKTGLSRREPKLDPPNRLSNEQLAKFGVKGSLDAWKEGVAKLAESSSVITLALAAAFASPLLSFFDWPNFLIIFFGGSKQGKSAAALAAASVMGIGHERDLPNWNHKDAALPEIAACFNDLPLVLNGIETSKLQEKELRECLKSVTYMLSDGVEIARHSSWNGGHAQGKWRTIVLVTSEDSFEAIAARVGEQRKDGEQARAFDVPATKRGHNTIIDRFTADAPEPGKVRDDMARESIAKLYRACADNHGVALKPYIDHLLDKNAKTLRREIEASRDEFIGEIKDKLHSEHLHHAAKSFGVVYAGGVQAIRANILPLSEKRLLRRITACFLRGLSAATDRPDVLKRGLKCLDAGLALAEKPGSDGDGRQVFVSASAAKGRRGIDAVICEVEAARVFRSWFKGDLQSMQATLRWLHEKGLLEVNDARKAIAAGFTLNSVRKNLRRGGDQVQCVVFKDPRPTLMAERAA